MQGLLEMMGIPYTGSGVLASAIGMDKIACKRVWQSVGLPTPEWRPVDPAETIGASFALPAKLPLVVKPDAEGSSVGVSIVRERPKLLRRSPRRVRSAAGCSSSGTSRARK